MAEADRTKYLPMASLLVGLIFIVGLYPLTIIWPSGWSWHTGQSHSLQIILGIYATLGVFLLVAGRNSLAHLCLIWFMVWSSVGTAESWQHSLWRTQSTGGTFGATLGAIRCSGLALLTPRGAAAKPAEVGA